MSNSDRLDGKCEDDIPLILDLFDRQGGEGKEMTGPDETGTPVVAAAKSRLLKAPALPGVSPKIEVIPT